MFESMNSPEQCHLYMYFIRKHNKTYFIAFPKFIIRNNMNLLYVFSSVSISILCIFEKKCLRVTCLCISDNLSVLQVPKLKNKCHGTYSFISLDSNTFFKSVSVKLRLG